MKHLVLLFLFFIYGITSFAQFDDEIPFGKVSHKDIDMKYYPADTSADAVVLDERGFVFIDQDKGRMVFDHYLKIKILKKGGFDEADFAIALYKSDKYKDSFDYLKASTYNADGTSIKETKMDVKKKFIENHEYADLMKFTLPDIHEGSVIEVVYKTESSFYFTLRTWEFQSNIPKVHSEYTTKIPANYLYNITLRGFLKLTSNDSKAIRDCYTYGGDKADCTLARYGMDNIPAFKTEEYMTAKKNFLSAIYFDLSEIRYFSGKVDRIQREWKEVDDELRESDNFGKQIKKARNVLRDKVIEVIGAETDELKKAKLIYNFINTYYTWNDEYSKYTDEGVKAAFEKKKGNDADINLSMVAALQEAGLVANPVILSTRNNGAIIEVHPVMTGFNYVIAAVDIAGARYLLDGTNRQIPFGVLPVLCLNGKGRLIAKEPAWIDLKPTVKYKSTTTMDLILADDGNISGNLSIMYQGYDAILKRTEILGFPDQKDYVDKIRKKWAEAEISNYELTNLNEIDKPLIEKVSVTMQGDGASNASTIYLNPFFVDRMDKNPFQSTERLYPVDYGAPEEEVFILTITFPATMIVDELPKNVALGLPQNGGKYLFSATQLGNKLSIISNRTISRPVYNSEEYHYLKELYTRIIQIQQSQIVFKRK